jgi:hypothetical protein
MKTAYLIDEARLGIMLNALRLPTIKPLWPRFAGAADREGWPAARFLAAIAEHGWQSAPIAGSDVLSPKRICRRARHSTASPSRPCRSSGKQSPGLFADPPRFSGPRSWPWLRETAGWPRAPTPRCSAHRGRKGHLAAAIGLALIETGWRVLFTKTTDLVRKLQVARRELQIEAALARLAKFDLLILPLAHASHALPGSG